MWPGKGVRLGQSRRAFGHHGCHGLSHTIYRLAKTPLQHHPTLPTEQEYYCGSDRRRLIGAARVSALHSTVCHLHWTDFIPQYSRFWSHRGAGQSPGFRWRSDWFCFVAGRYPEGMRSNWRILCLDECQNKQSQNKAFRPRKLGHREQQPT